MTFAPRIALPPPDFLIMRPFSISICLMNSSSSWYSAISGGLSVTGTRASLKVISELSTTLWRTNLSRNSWHLERRAACHACDGLPRK